MIITVWAQTPVPSSTCLLSLKTPLRSLALPPIPCSHPHWMRTPSHRHLPAVVPLACRRLSPSARLALK